jgi:hypothetical protein
MAKCANERCGRWRPDLLARRGRSGLSFDERWFCATACLAEHTQRILLDARAPEPTRSSGMPALRLGTLLVHQQVVTQELVRFAVRAQRQTGRRLGSQLLALGLVNEEEVVRALAAQAGIAYVTSIDAERVLDGCAGLSREAVRALGLVPFELRGGRLRVACVAPLRRLALAALREMTGHVVEPFMVADAAFDALMASYGAAVRPDRLNGAVHSLPDATTRIVRAAEEGRAARMHHARCDGYVWVRLEGATECEDFVLPDEPPKGEPIWLEAPTSR